MSLDAQNAEASVTGVASGTEDAAVQMPAGLREHGPDGGAAFIEGQIGEPFPPPLQPPPQPVRPGPNPVALTLGVVGGAVLLTVVALLAGKRRVKSTDAVLYDAGWQFSMSLTGALMLDGAQVMDAARMAPAP